jgi:hypothetical protein
VTDPRRLGNTGDIRGDDGDYLPAVEALLDWQAGLNFQTPLERFEKGRGRSAGPSQSISVKRHPSRLTQTALLSHALS